MVRKALESQNKATRTVRRHRKSKKPQSDKQKKLKTLKKKAKQSEKKFDQTQKKIAAKKDFLFMFSKNPGEVKSLQNILHGFFFLTFHL